MEAWPWRLVITPAGESFQFLRRIYHQLLSPHYSLRQQKYQDFESQVLLKTLLDQPEQFMRSTQSFATSVILSACYGVRLDQIHHPVVKELYSIWDSMLICGSSLPYTKKLALTI